MPASKKPKVVRPCRFCKKDFLSNNIRRLYCSAKCNTFYQRSLNPAKHRAYAAQLMRQRSPEKKKKDAIRKRELRLKREYNITPDQVDLMKIEQNDKCFLCRNFVKLVVDHSHKTGKIRKLLCHHCNRGLGFFSDDADLLLLASQYVREFDEN